MQKKRTKERVKGNRCSLQKRKGLIQNSKREKIKSKHRKEQKEWKEI